MRIGLTGAHGTGKTTLARALVKQWPEYGMVESTARRASAAGYPVNRDATPESQFMTTVARATYEDKLWRERAGSVISDRTPLDSLAYTLYQIENVWPPMPQFYGELSVDFVKEHMTKYDIVFYFPIYWEPKADGIRDPDVEYQASIDDYICRALSCYKIQHYVMPKGSTEDRVIYVKQMLSNLTI